MLYMEPPRTERHVVVPRKPHRWRVAFVLGMCAAVLFLGAEAKAQAPPPSESVSHAKVSLVAENASPPLGKPLWVGLLFQLDPGWHIYWQNPGDSGEPPKVQWLLPRGFRASFFDWPAPIRLGSGSVIDYGYEGQVLLMAPITVPEHAKASAIAAIAADVKYVVCSEICIPGKAHLTLSLPDTEKTALQTGDWHELFRQTRARLPKPGLSGVKEVVSDRDHFVLAVHGVPPPQSVTFFPQRPGMIENSAPQVLEPAGDGFRLTLKKSDQYTSYPLLRGILVLDSGPAYQISTMIQARPARTP